MFQWPVGLMDKASAPGARDSRFKSLAGQAIAHTVMYVHLIDVNPPTVTLEHTTMISGAVQITLPT